MASRGRLLSALAKAWIAVSTSIEVLRLSASRCGRRWPVVVCSSDRDAWCGWQRWLCRSTCHGGPRSLPVPGQQLVKSADRRAPRDHPLEHIGQIGLRVEVVQLGRVDQAPQYPPGPGSAPPPREERIFPARRTVARSLVGEPSRKLIAVLERERARKCLALIGACGVAVSGAGKGDPGHPTRPNSGPGRPKTLFRPA